MCASLGRGLCGGVGWDKWHIPLKGLHLRLCAGGVFAAGWVAVVDSGHACASLVFMHYSRPVDLQANLYRQETLLAAARHAIVVRAVTADLAAR